MQPQLDQNQMIDVQCKEQLFFVFQCFNILL